MKTCSVCKQTKDFSCFYKTSRSKDGIQPACKSCMAIAYNNSRAKKKEHYKNVALKRRHAAAEKSRLWKSKQGCFVCKETFGHCLELHHLDPSTKENDPSAMVNFSYSSFLKEAEKCVVLCANCHRKVHAGAINLTSL